MPRGQRDISEGNYYHIYTRAISKMLLFEDDDDRKLLLNLFNKNIKDHDGEMVAWCLMSNHYHLLMHMGLDSISEFIRVSNLTYALQFNARYKRSGHLFERRFGSQAIHSDRQLLCTLRYIHRNPVKAGISSVDEYPWSSFRGYTQFELVEEYPHLFNPAFVMNNFRNIAEFSRFHDADDDGGFTFIDDKDPANRNGGMSDTEAITIVASILGDSWRNTLPFESRETRNRHLREIRRAGLSIKQIERLTGIGRGIIQNA